MKILLHICCAPCAVYPVQVLTGQEHYVHGFFYNPNIHPYQEFARRAQALEEFAATQELPLIWDRSYDLEGFLRQVVFREAARCRFCYHLRLTAAARVARGGNFDAFTSTLLYSKYQKHELIREIGAQVAQEVGLPFYYADFREGWRTGQEKSKEMGLYRQQYCGCIYSERERYERGGKKSGGD
ncbi:MAG: epoxyqueuosine reductase QueH [Syntrophales bacterium]|nr:epoxyqueuosine reductase QueH [Syntrophales bacterium]MDD5640920.1 epoxyqueuosine reductase QueH [Syntrophales bacterium]